MTHEEMAELYELYVLGVLDEPAYSEIHRHLDEGCEHCRDQVSQAWETTALLAGLAEPRRPPSGLRRRTMSSVRPSPRPVRNWQWAMAALSTACLVLLGLLLWSVEQRQSLHSRMDALVSQRDDLRGQLQKLADERNQLMAQAQQMRATMNTLSSRENQLQVQLDTLSRQRSRALNQTQTMNNTIAGLRNKLADLRTQVQTLSTERTEALSRAQNLSRTVDTLTAQVDHLRGEVQRLSSERNVLLAQQNQLQSAVAVAASAGTRSLPFGRANDVPHGRVFLSPNGNVVFVGAHLPSLPEDRTYQLWLVPAKGAPQPAGVFRPSSSGEAVHLAQAPGAGANTAAVAVSVEPRGGSPAPTTKPMIVVPVQS